MDPLAWIGFALLSLLAVAAVFMHYGKREAPGRGRPLLAALRSGTLVLILLLLFDPRLPDPELTARAAAGAERVLLDASLSMALAADGSSRWDAAVAEAREAAGGADIVLFGDDPTTIEAAALDTLRPNGESSRLLPAIRSVAEAGAARVVVVTDGRIEDAAAARTAAERYGLPLTVRLVGGETENYAVAELEAPRWAEAGEELAVRAGVVAEAAAGDSLELVLRDDGQVVARQRLASPGPGRVAATTLRFTPSAPEAGRMARLEVMLTARDSAGDDDVRTAYVFVAGEPAGVTLVSFRPDWEPRFLVPVLERALGVPVRGFIRAGADRYLRMGTAADAGTAAQPADVRRAVAEAQLVVLHGYGPDAPAWARQRATEGGALIFPADAANQAPLPVPLGPARSGEWYVTGELPASPVASLLAGLPLEELPPLTGLHATEAADVWSPLLARRGRRGPGAAVLVGGGTGRERWAVALGEGYWRWAFAGGAAREVYDRLWSATAGWVVEETRPFAGAPLHPVDRVAARGRPVRWLTAVAGDSVRVSMTGGGGVAMDTVVALAGDTVATPAVPPGDYEYRLIAFHGDGRTEASGAMTVERYTPELSRPRADLGTGGEAGAAAADGGRLAAASRPLHASAWPYVLVVLLLCGEWALRRRWGLR